jgi:hypothetical protein
MFFGNNNLIRKNTSNPDPYWDNVVLFLKGNGENNSTNIIDSSPNPKIINRFGDTLISTAQSKYGGSSIYFDGNEDYLTTATGSDFNFSNLSFTIEFWLYRISVNGTNNRLFSTGEGGSEKIILEFGNSTLTCSLGFSGSFIAPVSTTISLSVWTHIAYVRDGNNFRLFKDGSLVSSNTSTYSIPNATSVVIGAWLFSGSYSRFILGYIDSFRITKGVARYTANFNPEDTSVTYLN